MAAAFSLVWAITPLAYIGLKGILAVVVRWSVQWRVSGFTLYSSAN